METKINLLSLDVGTVRIGVASAKAPVFIASPLTYVPNNHDVIKAINDLINEHQVNTLVVGLPRGLNGQETDQTKTVREFVTKLEPQIDVPIVLQDEALTSQKAEDELARRGKPYQKGDVDALAACFILEDYLADNRSRLG